MASSRSAPFFVLLALAALLLAAQCSAGDDAPTEPMLDPKCQEFTTMCTVDTCTDFCLSIGLGAYQGFCSFHDLTMYCCCPIPAGTPPRRT